MSVSRQRGETPTIIGPGQGRTPALPPFWELEDLLAAGLNRDTALMVMAARRARLRIVGAASMEGKPQERAFTGFAIRPTS